ncbi:MAG TPA: hypothetical protein VHF88_08900 [Thermoleophilaceae bacterium]|nr:hypothetical protein [Thermoleophilaceae bacterium]
MVRRSLALGAGLLVLILLIFGVRSCMDNQKESAITDWVRDVDALMKQSNGESEALFDQLGGGGGTDVDVENALNSFRIQSAQLVDQANGLDRPGELDRAQEELVETLTFRAEGIAQIADALPNALTDGEQAEGAARRIAEAMQLFVTSDQIYFKRVVPALDEVLEQEGLLLSLTKSTFLPDLSWLDPAEVADRLSGIASGGGEEGDEEAAPGLHGNGLGTVTLGGQTLVAGGSTSVTATGDLSFEVQVINQGENTETDVTVTATVGSGADEIVAEGVIDTIAAGESQVVTIRLEETPPTGQAVPITIEIELVPGEDADIGNNSGEFSVIFTS